MVLLQQGLFSEIGKISEPIDLMEGQGIKWRREGVK
jgi:hypothetical protein